MWALGIDKTRTKLFRRGQLAGLQQRHEVVEVFQGVLDWRGRKEQEKLAGESVHGLPGLRRAIAQVMRLIHDQHVPVDLLRDGEVRWLFEGVERRDDTGVV